MADKFGVEPPQERLKDFIFIPKRLAWRESHKSERDFVVSSDVSFLLLVGNLPPQALPSLLPGGGRGLESQELRVGRPQGSTVDLLSSGPPIAVPTTFRLTSLIF